MTERLPECDAGGTATLPADAIETAFREIATCLSRRLAIADKSQRMPPLFSEVQAGNRGRSPLDAFSEHCD